MFGMKYCPTYVAFRLRLVSSKPVGTVSILPSQGNQKHIIKENKRK